MLPSLLELARTREYLGNITIIGANGEREPDGVQMKTVLERFTNFETIEIVMNPAEETDYSDYYQMSIITEAKPGDIGIVFTSDGHHFPIAMDLVDAGMHTHFNHRATSKDIGAVPPADTSH